MEITRSRYSYKQHPVKRPKGHRLALWTAVLLIVFSSVGYTAAAFSKDLSDLSVTAVVTAERQPEKASLVWPASGQAAIGSLDDGLLARSLEVEQTRPIASITKIVTALAVLQKAPLALGDQGKVYTLTERDRSLYNSYLAKNGSVVPVTPGQTLTQYQSLQALLMASANNIADSLVLEHFGSMEAYILYANELMKSWELNQTVIADASGFSPQTVSTPSELIRIAQRALQQPALATIMAQSEATIPGIGVIRNTNRLLTQNGVIGLKTGTTDEAGSCLLFAADHAVDENYTVTVIGVVLGSPNAATVFRDSKALLDSAFPNFVKTTLLSANTTVGTVTSEWGEQVQIVTESDLSAYGWKETVFPTQTQIKNLENSDIASNESMGTISVVGETETVRLLADGTISEPSNIWRLKNYL